MQVRRQNSEHPAANPQSVVFEITDFDEKVVRTLTLKTGVAEPAADQRRLRRLSERLIDRGYSMSWRTLGGEHGTRGTVRMAPSASRPRRRR
ncbi:hypothetical protein BJP27_24545 (plasmid) [Pseudomonas oryzihabitans]|nr:hypothetical protein BJP27_23895 [Pseudomonas psychrotolerans]APQ14741.1 hypothetical protein BJP27_24545 [Pseudomonas psychrotolerans]